MEAVKQGSAAIGLRSDTHAILLTLKVSSDAAWLHTDLPAFNRRARDVPEEDDPDR